jgi:hypothetical protein
VNERPSTPAGWFPDPLARYEFRWFNGTAWTADVSVDGRRYVDPLPLDAPQPVRATRVGPGDTGPSTQPSRAMSVIALIGGLVAVLTAWMPFLVVFGAIGAVTALVVGVFAVRAVREGRAIGREAARAGLVLGAIGLCMVPVGIWLTSRAFGEFERFVDPGRHRVEITECASSNARRATFAGTVTNLEDDDRSFAVTVQVFADGRSQGTTRVEVDDVPAGGQVSFDGSLTLDDGGELTCEVFDVTGPFPFGLRPAG